MLAVDFYDDLVVADDQDFGAAARTALVADDTSVAAALAGIIVLLMSSLVLPLARRIAVVDDGRCGVLGGVCVGRGVQCVVVVVVLFRLVLDERLFFVIVIIDSLVLLDIVELSVFGFVFGSVDAFRRLISF